MSEFIEYLQELFEKFGPVHTRKMFGGYGIYHDGVMFGLVEDDTLYLKSDETSVEYFQSRGLGQFEYDRGGKTVKMSYYRAPDEIMDNPDEASLWARRAWEVAFRAKKTGKR